MRIFRPLVKFTLVPIDLLIFLKLKRQAQRIAVGITYNRHTYSEIKEAIRQFQQSLSVCYPFTYAFYRRARKAQLQDFLLDDSEFTLIALLKALAVHHGWSA